MKVLSFTLSQGYSFLVIRHASNKPHIFFTPFSQAINHLALTTVQSEMEVKTSMQVFGAYDIFVFFFFF